MGTTNKTHEENSKRVEENMTEEQQQPQAPVTDTQQSLSPIALEFQPDAIEIEERPVPKAAKWTLYTLVGLIVAAILWATFAEVDRVVTTRGKLITVDKMIVKQPLEDSIIRKVHVRVNDSVKKGQILATLDPTFTTADVSQIQARLSSLNDQINRLEAEYNNDVYLKGRDENTYSLNEELQFAIYQARRIEYGARIDSYRDRLAHIEASLETNKKEQEGLKKRAEVLGEIEEMFEQLRKSAHGSKLRLLQALDQRLVVQNNLESMSAKSEEMRRQAASLRAEQEAFIEEWRRKVIEQLVEGRRERDRLKEELSKAERRSSLVVMRSPMDAVVLEVAERSVGSVIRVAEPLVTLVPLDAEIIAEIEIDPSNIGYMRPGQDVRIKLDAFPFQRHGIVNGQVINITESTIQSQSPAMTPDGKPAGQKQVYRARVKIVDKELRNLPDHFRLRPGMTLTSEVKVGTRNVMAYFLHPFLKGLDESFKEP